MADEVKIAVYEGGELVVPEGAGKGREVALALPLNRLIVKMVRVPVESRDDMAGYATPILKAMSPYPDEPLTVSCEVVREAEDGVVVVAAALPEGSSDDLATALDGAGLNVMRIDALALGELRSAWPKLALGGDSARRMLLFGGRDCVSLFVLDGDCPVAVRALSPGCDMRREVMLSLLDAEEFGGAAALSEIVVVGDVPTEGLDAFAPVRAVGSEGIDPVAGIAERSMEATSLNALPDSWREVLDETRFKRKMKIWLGTAGGVWALVMAVLFGVPKVYDYLTHRQETMSKAHRASYNKVREKKDQVEAVRLVSNHDLGALETLRVVTSVLPENVTLKRWNFKRGDKLTFSGVVEDGDQQKVYSFKDGLAGVVLSQVSEREEDGDTPFFTEVLLPSGVRSKGNTVTFDVDCDFKTKEVE